MQEEISQETKQEIECCIHNLYIGTCTFCRHKAAPRQDISAYGRTTAAQYTAIINLAQRKQRSLPANIRSWSVEFASRYIKFLIGLPFPREVLPRLEQFEAEHSTATDIYKATHQAKPTEYYKANCQDAENNPMLSENEKAALAKEVENV